MSTVPFSWLPNLASPLALAAPELTEAWTSGLTWSHAVTDGMLAFAFLSLPLGLSGLLRAGFRLPSHRLFWCLGAFVVCGGLTFAASFLNFWTPVPWLWASLKAATAFAAIASALSLRHVLPAFLNLPGPLALAAMNKELEHRVSERTSALNEANLRLTREVDQRRAAQEENARLARSLQHRLEEMEKLFQILPVGVGIADSPDCRNIRCNRTFSDMIAVPTSANASMTAPQGEAPTNFRVLVHGKVCAPEDLPIQTAARENRPVLNFEEVIERSDGVTLHVIANVIPLHDAEGHCRGAVGTFVDVTPSKRFEEELRLVVDAAPNAMIRTDEQGTITLVNAQAERLFGYSREELIGSRVDRLIPKRFGAGHLSHFDHYFHAPQTRFLGASKELYGLRKDGTEVPVEIGLNPIRSSTGLTVIASIIDISERKRNEQQQRELDHKLQETQKLESLGVLAGGIAHDFNNLLTGILGNASLLSQELPPSSPLQAWVSDIEDASQRAADLCRQMLAYAGKGRFVVREINLNHIVQSTAELLRLSLPKSCTLQVSTSEGLPQLMADANQLRQVVMNLVLNSHEAIGRKPGLINLKTSIQFLDTKNLAVFTHGDQLEPGDHVLLEIEDNGVGMDEATLAKIFDPFFTTKFTGRGLGLAAVLGIVRGHHGALRVTSSPGKGTVFTLAFPGAPKSEPSAPASAITTPSGETAAKVLIVDDEEAVRAVAARMLEKRGFQVETVDDGAEALARVRAMPNHHCLVLLDLTMPKLDGEATFVQLQQLKPGLPVVLMSGFNEQEAVGRFAGKGLAGFLQKPFTNEALLKEVRRVLDGGKVGGAA